MYYVLDENNNKVEAYSKEEVLAVINKAIADGSLANLVADAAFITKVKCFVGGGTHLFAFITQAKRNELKENNQLVDNCHYFITDDTTADEINKQLEEINKSLKEISTTLNKMPNRIYEYSGDWTATLTAGVTEFDASNYIGNKKGYFRVTIKCAVLFFTLDLIAANNAMGTIYGTSELMAEIMISNGKILLDGESCSIVAIDYYEAA